MPISRFVAVSFSPASSVLSRTLVRTGNERFETARLTTDRPRARFSCMTDSFTLGSLRGLCWVGSIAIHDALGYSLIFPLSSHSVITIIMVLIAWTAPRGRAAGGGGPLPVDGGSRVPEWVPLRGSPVDCSPGQSHVPRRRPSIVHERPAEVPALCRRCPQ